MTIKNAAQNVIGAARDGVGWIALWKVGRGWESTDFYLDYNESTGRILPDPDDLPEMKRIVQEDPMAVLVNSYVHNLGNMEYWETSVRDLACALKWQYEMQHSLLIDAIN